MIYIRCTSTGMIVYKRVEELASHLKVDLDICWQGCDIRLLSLILVMKISYFWK